MMNFSSISSLKKKIEAGAHKEYSASNEMANKIITMRKALYTVFNFYGYTEEDSIFLSHYFTTRQRSIREDCLLCDKVTRLCEERIINNEGVI